MRNEEAWLVSSYVFYKLLWIKGTKFNLSQTDMLCMNKQFERYETAYRNIIQILNGKVCSLFKSETERLKTKHSHTITLQETTASKNMSR